MFHMLCPKICTGQKNSTDWSARFLQLCIWRGLPGVFCLWALRAGGPLSNFEWRGSPKSILGQIILFKGETFSCVVMIIFLACTLLDSWHRRPSTAENKVLRSPQYTSCTGTLQYCTDNCQKCIAIRWGQVCWQEWTAKVKQLESCDSMTTIFIRCWNKAFCWLSLSGTFPQLAGKHFLWEDTTWHSCLPKNRRDERASEKIQRSSVLSEAAPAHTTSQRGNKMHRGDCGHSSNENVRENYFLSATTLSYFCWWENKDQHGY